MHSLLAAGCWLSPESVEVRHLAISGYIWLLSSGLECAGAAAWSWAALFIMWKLPAEHSRAGRRGGGCTPAPLPTTHCTQHLGWPDHPTSPPRWWRLTAWSPPHTL